MKEFKVVNSEVLLVSNISSQERKGKKRKSRKPTNHYQQKRHQAKSCHSLHSFNLMIEERQKHNENLKSKLLVLIKTTQDYFRPYYILSQLYDPIFVNKIIVRKKRSVMEKKTVIST